MRKGQILSVIVSHVFAYGVPEGICQPYRMLQALNDIENRTIGPQTAVILGPILFWSVSHLL